MNEFLTHLRDFNFTTVVLRLLLAFLSGMAIGYGRSRKRRTTGMRTFILTSLGSAMTVLLATYEYEMLCGPWARVVEEVGMKFDGSRYSAQVISGIGFLAAGTILSIGHQQVSGLSTASGLFASVSLVDEEGVARQLFEVARQRAGEMHCASVHFWPAGDKEWAVVTDPGRASASGDGVVYQLDETEGLILH